MSAIDRGDGFAGGEQENTGLPRSDGHEPAPDARGAGEPAARSAQPEAAGADQGAAVEQRGGPDGEPRIERSAVPRRPARGHGLAAPSGASLQSGSAEQSKDSEPPPTHRPPEPAPTPPQEPPPPGPFTAHGGGFGPPPPPPPGGSSPPVPQPSGPARRDGRGRVVLVAAATALVTSLIVGPAASVATSQLMSGDGPATSAVESSPASAPASGSVSAVAHTALPSVVSIGAGSGSGSGFVISSDGLIVTNNHVVAGADRLTVQFNDGTEASATVVGTDPVSDLAVLQAEGGSGLTPATFGNSDQIDVGADVVAIGSPLGLSGTVTSGVVSALDRPVNTGPTEQRPDDPLPLPDQGQDQSAPPVGTSTVIDAIQTDAPINPGNSGGPLMNMNGEVIGINTAIATTSSGFGTAGQAGSIGLGFAIPINQAKPIIEELIADGEASYAAIEATITAPDGGGQGAEVVEVSPGGAADQAGLRAGDVITRVGDRVVSDPNVLIAAIRSHRPGDTVTITYHRGGDEGRVQVALAGQSASSIGE